MNLATVERIINVNHHPNADKLDIVKVLGYDCIVGRDQYKVGDLIVFIQPDSILPSDHTWCQELLRYTSRGRIRSIRLRGEWSMGLIVSTGVLPEDVEEGTDVTEFLGVTKYEPPLPGNMQAKGGLPFNIPKTDEDRWQNLRTLDSLMGLKADITLKRDGSSATYYCVLPGHWPGVEEVQVGITSRNLELKLPTETEEINSKWHEAERRYDILNRLRTFCEEYGVSLAIRGEITGAGIQAFARNPHANGPTDFAMFDVYNITEKRHENKDMPFYYRNVAGSTGLPEIELLGEDVILNKSVIDMYDHALKKLNDKPFEGVVVKHSEGSFKIINKWYDSEKE